MAKHKKRVVAPCAYCGIIAELTEDHVVPQCLFGTTIPKDIPVVLSCATCNNVRKSSDDTFLRDMLVCDVDTFEHPVAQSIFGSTFSRAIERNQSRLARHVSTRLRPVPVFTPSGLFAGNNYGAPLPTGDVTRILGTMVRGLHQYYLKQSLVNDVKVTVHRIRDVTTVLPVVQVAVQLGKLTYVAVGDSTIFNCIYGIDPTDPALTMWFLAFYSSPKSPGAIYRVTTKAKQTKGGTV